MAYSFNRVTDNVDTISAVDINELQSAIETMSATVDALDINATFMLSAAGGTPAATNGCADAATMTTTSNLLTYKYCAFDKDTAEILWWNHPLPDDYDGGTVTFKVHWEHPATTTNFKVAWDLAGVAIGDGDAIDTAVGTAVQVNDEGGTTNDLYTSAASSALTIATVSGDPAAGDMVFWRLRRVANDATNDTLAVDAYFLYVEVFYTRA